MNSYSIPNLFLGQFGVKRAVGFKVGDLTKGQMAKFTDSFSATMKSKPTGFLTIEGPYSRSMVPSLGGNATSSIASETLTLTAQNYIDQIRGAGVKK